MKTILRVCRTIRDISDAEFAAAEAAAKGQLSYLSPLKMATTAEQHKLGKYNMEVLGKLSALREVIRRGP